MAAKSRCSQHPTISAMWIGSTNHTVLKTSCRVFIEHLLHMQCSRTGRIYKPHVAFIVFVITKLFRNVSTLNGNRLCNQEPFNKVH